MSEKSKLKMFLTASDNLQVHILPEDSLESLVIDKPLRSKILTASFSYDNTYIAVLRENEKPQIYSGQDKDHYRLVHTINVPNISAIAFKKTTKKNIALGGKSGDVSLYDTKTRSVAQTYSKISNSVRALEFTCNDQQLCGIDSSIFFVLPEIDRSHAVKKFKKDAECCILNCHSFIPNRVCLGYKNGLVEIWDVQSEVELFTLDLGNSSITGVVLSSCGNFLIASGQELRVCGINYETGSATFQYPLEQEKNTSCIDLSPDDKYLAVGLNDGTLKIYDIKDNLKQIFSSKLHESAITAIAFENKSKEINSNFSSVVQLSEQYSKDIDSIDNDILSIKTKSLKNDNSSKTKEMEHFKNKLLDIVKTEMDALENQLSDYCEKFQKFLDNEFETIYDVIREKWGIFDVGDMNQILKAMCPDDSRSN